MTAFSMKDFIKRAKALKLRRGQSMARGQVNSDFDVAHPDEVRDAQSNNFGNLNRRIKTKFDKDFDRAIGRRNKLIGK